MLVPLESSSAVLVMMSSKCVSICSRFHARWANSGKITISKGVPLFDALVRGESPNPAAPKLSHYKLETLGYHTVKTRCLYLTWAWFGTGSWHPRRTDWQTDKIPIANTRSQQYLPVQLSRVKKSSHLPAVVHVWDSSHVYWKRFTLAVNPNVLTMLGDTAPITRVSQNCR